MCRRVCYDDGSAKMWGDSNSANFTDLESGNDSGIELMFTYDTNKKLTGVIANVACPAQVLEHQSFISSDYMGKVRRNIQEKYGKDVGFLGLISPAGDMCPRDLVRWVDSPVCKNDPNINRETIIERRADPSMFDIKGCELAANGIGGAIAMNIVSPIIESNRTGYKTAYLVIAAVLFVVGVIVVSFIRDNPKGKEHGEVEITKKKSRGKSWLGLEYRDTLKKWYFYAAIFCVFGVGFFLTACNGVAVQHMKDVGLDPVFVTTIWSIHSLVLAFFKFLTGFLYDKTGLRSTMIICTVTAIIVVICLALVTPTTEGKVLAIIYSVFSGLALPLETVMLPIIAGDLFGQRSFDEVLGISVSANAIGYAVASPVMNLFYDIYHTYSYGMFICLGFLVVVMILMQVVITAAHRQRLKFEVKQLEDLTNE